MQTLQPAATVLANSVKPKGIITDRKKHRFDSMMQSKMRNVENALRVIEPTLKQPDLPSVQCADDISVNAQVWAERIDQQLLGDEVGRVQVIPEGLLCTFYEQESDGYWWNVNYSKVRHVHKISRPHFRRLPFHGEVPKKGQEIINALCDAGMKRDVRIVTGDLIGEDVQTVRTWQEDGAIKYELKGLRNDVVDFGNDVKKAGQVVGRGIGSVGAGIAAAVGAMTAMFAADPCIVIGDICYWGWK